MQVRKKDMGKRTAVILLTGCFMLTAAHSIMAAEAPVPIDLTKIQPAVNMKNSLSGSTSGMSGSTSGVNARIGQISANTAASSSAMAGAAMEQASAQKMEGAAPQPMIDPGIMAEMQKKLWLKTWVPFRRPFRHLS